MILIFLSMGTLFTGIIVTCAWGNSYIQTTTP